MQSPFPSSNPYVGPRAFELGEQLYGRSVETRDLVSLLCAERIVLLHSPSGAGKTSLIQAVLIPRMRERRFFVRPLARVNREPTQPIEAGHLNRYIFSALSSFESALPPSEQIPEAELAGLTLADYRERRPRPAGASFELFIFDQFEEILTLNSADPDAKTAFFAQLSRLLYNDTCWALFSMREDFLGALDPYLKYIPDRLGTNFRLDLLGPKAAELALQIPAKAAGVDFINPAVQRLVNDLRRVQVQLPDGQMEARLGPYVEPVQLQVVAYRLWESLKPEDKTIGLDHLTALGDVGQALGDYYAQRVAAVAQESGVGERAIRDWFDRRLINEGGIRTPVHRGPETSAELANAAVHRLEDAHLVRAEQRGGAIWYELAHDRLIEPVQKNNAVWFAQNLSLFQRQAELWNIQGRPEGLLLIGRELEQVEGWVKTNPGLFPHERDFLEACHRAQKQVERERRRNWLLRLLAILASIAALAAAGFAIQANDSNHQAQEQKATAQAASTLAIEQRTTAEESSRLEAQQRATAEESNRLESQQRATAQSASALALQQSNNARINQLVALASIYQTRQPDLSLLLSVEGFLRRDDYQSRNGLYQNLQSTPNQLLSYLKGHTNSVTEVTFSPDGKILASSSLDNTIILWNVATRQAMGRPLKGHTFFITSLAFSPDGRILASGSYDKTVRLWDVSTQQEIGEPIQGDAQGTYGFSSLVFSPDGNILAASNQDDKTIRLWDVTTRQQIGEPLQGYKEMVSSLTFSPDGKFLISYSSDGSILIWDTVTWHASNVLLQKQDNGYSEGPYSIVFSPDGKTFATSSTGNIYIWDLQTGQPVGKPLYGHTNYIRSFVFSTDGKTIVSSSDDNTIRFWSVTKRQELREPLQVQSTSAETLDLSPNGHTLASGSKDGMVYLWDTTLPDTIQSGQPFFGNYSTVHNVVFSPDGKILVSGSYDNLIRVWDVATRQPIGDPLQGQDLTKTVNGLAISPDSKILASGSSDYTIRLWDIVTRKPIGDLLQGHTAPINTLMFSPNGKTLVSGSNDHTIRLWDVNTRQPISDPLQGHSNSVLSLAFSPDGKILASGSYDGTIRLWNTANWQQIGDQIHEPTGSVDSMVFSPDGKILATGSYYNAIIFWDVATRQMIGEPFQGQDFANTVNGLAFSPDGKILASGSNNGDIRLWDVMTRQPIGETLEKQGNSVFSLAYSPDGKIMVTGGNDIFIPAWDVDPASWTAGACRIANRNLTQAEWQQFIGLDEPYRKTCTHNP